ncbi:hypothetical protein B9Z55_001395 [Caenorhabditis nigoni]|uniref:Uncharacterized protein n=1 Tax=Caenorhabditis nigoni TaxID=1611254 RepID=A0A2G5VFG9_9PELO|nr:hypothetical protein B9Z55_001395 [Caenorhabditis nigoni]
MMSVFHSDFPRFSIKNPIFSLIFCLIMMVVVSCIMYLSCQVAKKREESFRASRIDWIRMKRAEEPPNTTTTSTEKGRKAGL